LRAASPTRSIHWNWSISTRRRRPEDAARDPVHRHRCGFAADRKAAQSLMLAAIAATWASVWVRAFLAYGISRSIPQRSTLSAGHGL
jgi:hypothetical protein